MKYLDIQAVAHGQYSTYRRTKGQQTVVQYSMLDGSCPIGKSYRVSSLDRIKRSASSRYKKSINTLNFIDYLQ